MNVSGPQAPTIIENGTESYDIELTGPGLYFITVQARDEQNKTYTDTAAVQVWDRDALDSLLQAK